MKKTYFHRVHEQTPTRFWINNPTLEQARLAIEAGAIGCTTNPSYVSKLFGSEEDLRVVNRAIDLLLPYEKNDLIVASKVQQMMVARLADLFLPLYEKSGGREGLVTIQGDPFAETDTALIVEEGLENRKIGENVCIKIPVTTWGIEAIRVMVEKNIPTMATEVMGLSQAVSICEEYQKASSESGNTPPFFVTHITGILDDHFKRVIKANNLKLDEKLVKYAGLSIAKKEYELLKSRNYPGIMIGGGARKLEDFTELVGGDLHITINWKGTADTLIEADGLVVSRIEDNLSEEEMQILKDRLPDYGRALEVDGMQVDEYYDYGGVELFRTSFQKGWNELLALIAERRRNA
ncbi:MAG: transaldolase family protein [Sphaerochaeta sp.]|jgi:transaldolase|uniref:transaldolase family protein n=1 Tax=unclassified Sphaerochaeta TaxID=2637943 RepID=UPI0025E04416|nr:MULTISPECIES: transaldolase family protein [unclassified Sphaerochaeta]MDX9824937.1 transaldolase family protein [Sphaerochaeta sp.]MEA4865606.1 transaldolase family protein [Sphaerochaeta sp.]HPE93536.1 transaldolase family protein [Sphaerochaeta sp.]